MRDSESTEDDWKVFATRFIDSPTTFSQEDNNSQMLSSENLSWWAKLPNC